MLLLYYFVGLVLRIVSTYKVSFTFSFPRKELSPLQDTISDYAVKSSNPYEIVNLHSGMFSLIKNSSTYLSINTSTSSTVYFCWMTSEQLMYTYGLYSNPITYYYAYPVTKRIEFKGSLNKVVYIQESNNYHAVLFRPSNESMDITGTIWFNNNGSQLQAHDLGYDFVSLFFSLVYLIIFPVTSFWILRKFSHLGIVLIPGIFFCLVGHIFRFIDFQLQERMFERWEHIGNISAAFMEISKVFVYLFSSLCSIGWTILERGLSLKEQILIPLSLLIYFVLGMVRIITTDTTVFQFAVIFQELERVLIVFLIILASHASALRFRFLLSVLDKEIPLAPGKKIAFLLSNYYKYEVLLKLRNSISVLLLFPIFFLFTQIYLTEFGKSFIAYFYDQLLTAIFFIYLAHITSHRKTFDLTPDESSKAEYESQIELRPLKAQGPYDQGNHRASEITQDSFISVKSTDVVLKKKPITKVIFSPKVFGTPSWSPEERRSGWTGFNAAIDDMIRRTFQQSATNQNNT
jgi:hypothetical protein